MEWYTPVYVVGGWNWKNRRIIAQQEKPLEEVQVEVIIPNSQEVIQSYEQLDLFKLS